MITLHVENTITDDAPRRLEQAVAVSHNVPEFRELHDQQTLR
ncbi:MAG TPA: hypothetical protein VGL05_03820 [Kribbella sp.]